jgi:hypothetical protein
MLPPRTARRQCSGSRRILRASSQANEKKRDSFLPLFSSPTIFAAILHQFAIDF